MRGWIASPILDIGNHAKMSALFQLSALFQPTFNATLTDCQQPPPEDLLRIFFSQHSVARVEISSND